MFRTQAVWIQKLREACSTLMQWFIPAGSLHLVLNPAHIHITGISTHWSLHVVFLHIKFPSPRVIICIGYLPLLGWWCCSMKTLRLIVLVLQRSLETKQLWRIMQAGAHKTGCSVVQWQVPQETTDTVLGVAYICLQMFQTFTKREAAQTTSARVFHI